MTTRTTDIIPLARFKENMEEEIEKMNAAQQPLFLVENDQVQAVVLPAAMYRDLQAMRRAKFWETVDAVHEHNRDVDPDEIQAAVDLAVEEVRR